MGQRAQGRLLGPRAKRAPTGGRHRRERRPPRARRQEKSGTEPRLLFRNAVLLEHAGDPALRPCYRVMIDFDSTVFPILDALRRCPGGERVSYEAIQDYAELPALIEGGAERMGAMFAEIMPFAAMREHEPIAGVGPALRTLVALGCELHVKTDRPVEVSRDVARYLRLHRLPFASLDCESGLDKLALCQSEGIGIVVDDHPGFLLRAREAGLDALSLRYRYHDGIAHERGIDLAPSWPVLARRVAAAVERRVLARCRASI